MSRDYGRSLTRSTPRIYGDAGFVPRTPRIAGASEQVADGLIGVTDKAWTSTRKMKEWGAGTFQTQLNWLFVFFFLFFFSSVMATSPGEFDWRGET